MVAFEVRLMLKVSIVVHGTVRGKRFVRDIIINRSVVMAHEVLKKGFKYSLIGLINHIKLL